jgi:hypothetical protein
MTGDDAGIQCAARRPVSGGRTGIAFIKCYLIDGHDGLHFDATEGIEWQATHLSGSGGHHLKYLVIHDHPVARRV